MNDPLPIVERLIALLREPLSEADLDAALPRPYHGELATRELDRGTPAALARVAAALEEIDDPYQAARLACIGGTLIEVGAPAALLAPALLDRLERQNASVAALLDEVGEIDDVTPYRRSHPDAARAWLGGGLLHLAVMTTLSRECDARVEARRRPGLVENVRRAGARLENGYYVEQLLDAVDRFRFVALYPAETRGYRMIADGVRSQPHLWILLQDLLISTGRCEGQPLDAGLVSFVKNEGGETPPRLAHTAWQFFLPEAARDWPTALVTGAAQIHEATPLRDTPRVDDLPVVLIAEAGEQTALWLARAAPLHGAHRGALEIEAELSPEEVARWFARCGQPEADEP